MFFISIKKTSKKASKKHLKQPVISVIPRVGKYKRSELIQVTTSV